MTSRAANRRKSGRKPADKPSNDGAPATVAFCPSCGAGIQSAARFCHACGVSLEAPSAPASWDVKTVGLVAVAAVAIVAVAFTAAIIVSRDKAEAPPPAPAAGSGAGSGPPVDLASLTPRQAADHLFNRVMMASEQGNLGEALQFAPMALQAYDDLPTLDGDARYHLGLIHSVTGDIGKVREQIASLEQLAPGHLLGLMLEHAVAEQTGDGETAAQAYAAFLAAYDSEITAGRREYADHRTVIERFRTAAQASTNRSD